MRQRFGAYWQRRRGFTLVEAMTTVLVFGFFIGALFAMFHMGTRGFQLSVARQGVQNTARKLALYIDKEFRSSHLLSFDVESGSSRVVGGVDQYRRDGVCFVSVKDWDDPDVFDPLTLSPRWDRYTIYYATLHDNPYGKLVRATVEPPADEIGPFPFGPFRDNAWEYMQDDPRSNGGYQTSYRVLADNVAYFKVSVNRVGGKVRLQLGLRQDTGKHRHTGKREGALFEMDYSIVPMNTK